MIQTKRVLNSQGKQAAVDHFLRGASVAHVCDSFQVSRSTVEQVIREALIQTVQLIAKEQRA